MRRRRVCAVVALGLLQLVVVVTLALAGPDETTHGAPVRVVAPAVVATSVVDRVNALPGHPLDAVPLATTAEAVDSVRDGRSVAAIVVDLSRDTDRLYVASVNGAELDRALRRQVDAVQASYGRRVEVTDLVRARDAAGRGHVYALAGVSVVTGLLVAIAITWRRGPRSSTLAGGARRLATYAAVAVVAGAALGAYGAVIHDGRFGMWWLLCALTVLASTSTTLALESLFGVYGIGVATTVLVLAAAPLVTLVHPLLLPEPWATITPWLPHGAALDAGTSVAYFDGSEALRPLLVLAAWTALSVLTSVVSRRELARDAG